jgi:hypothetical protein
MPISLFYYCLRMGEGVAIGDVYQTRKAMTLGSALANCKLGPVPIDTFRNDEHPIAAGVWPPMIQSVAASDATSEGRL